MDNNEKDFKENRIKEISIIYYSQPDIKRFLYEFGEKRDYQFIFIP